MVEIDVNLHFSFLIWEEHKWGTYKFITNPQALNYYFPMDFPCHAILCIYLGVAEKKRIILKIDGLGSTDNKHLHTNIYKHLHHPSIYKHDINRNQCLALSDCFSHQCHEIPPPIRNAHDPNTSEQMNLVPTQTPTAPRHNAAPSPRPSKIPPC